MKNNLIGISSRIGGEKDLAFKIINFLNNPISDRYSFEYCENYGLTYDVKYKNKKFADKIKDIACMLIGFTRYQLEDRNFKDKELGKDWNNKTPRLIMQQLGTECGRNILHKNVWVNASFANYKLCDNWIITDVRFPNEVKAIKERGGIVIRIIRPCSSCGLYEGAHDIDCINNNLIEHESEKALDGYTEFDYVIDNSGSILDLQNKLKIIL